jgi:hypothetical protein
MERSATRAAGTPICPPSVLGTVPVHGNAEDASDQRVASICSHYVRTTVAGGYSGWAGAQVAVLGYALGICFESGLTAIA